MGKSDIKYSILLPTRNRLEYLKYALASVIKQNYGNWEIIVSDNASEEDIGAYVQTLNEPRIKYSRSEKFLTITESWNRSVDLCIGDYVIMLGDDDLLLQNYFLIVNRLVENFKEPELIYTNSFLYAYPNVIPNFPKGVFQPFGALNGMPKSEVPFILDFSSRLGIVKETLRFESAYSTNMQHVLIRKSLLERVKKDGKFFHSPYPDVYAMSALFIEAEQVLIYPREIVVIGVTPKSHGYYAFNNKQKEAVDFLNIKNEIASIPHLQNDLLPPYNSIQTFWLGAIHLLNRYFPLKKFNLEIDYKKYRKEQIKNVLNITNKIESKLQYKHLTKLLSPSEKISLLYRSILLKQMKRFAPQFLIKIYKTMRGLTKKNKNKIVVCTPVSSYPENQFLNALEIFEKIEAKI